MSFRPLETSHRLSVSARYTNVTSIVTVFLLLSIRDNFVSSFSITPRTTTSTTASFPPRYIPKSTLRHRSSNNKHHLSITPHRPTTHHHHQTSNDDETTTSSSETSKRSMLSFALPALGIFLANPLLSNIDNAFIGHTAGTIGLAALSPATICTDQMLYLFSFLSRATTGIVSRAYGSEKNTPKARDASVTPLSASLCFGAVLSLVYATLTPRMLAALNVDAALRPAAAGYVYIRGMVAAAALAQSVSLSVSLATRDAVTPLKIVGLAAGMNVLGDFLLCVWPFRLGCAGAAAATAIATLFSSVRLAVVLKAKGLFPQRLRSLLRLPTRREMGQLLEYTGPLLAITVTRLVGFVSMQRAATRLGVTPLAAYQIGVNVMLFFLLFGEPLSQLSQTKLPSLIDDEDGGAIVASLKSILTLACLTAMTIGMVAWGMLTAGSAFFTQDVTVRALTTNVAPTVVLAIILAIMGVAVDGAMLASRDFGFILLTGITSLLVQLRVLPLCTTLEGIFLTFAMRLGTYFSFAIGRLLLGKGRLGKIISDWRGQERSLKIVETL